MAHDCWKFSLLSDLSGTAWALMYAEDSVIMARIMFQMVSMPAASPKSEKYLWNASYNNASTITYK